MSNNGLPNLIFFIPRFGKRKSLSKQTQKDQGFTRARVKRNETQISRIMPILEILCGQNPQKKDLLVLAQEIENHQSIQLDRLAKRSKDCLICWFCENWDAISSKLNELCATRPRSYDSRNSCVAPAADQKVPSISDNFYFDSFNFLDSSFDPTIEVFNDQIEDLF